VTTTSQPSVVDGDMATATTTVLRRYDELADLVASIAGRGPGSSSATAMAAAFLAAEARRLDLGCWDSWLDMLTDDIVVWVPLRRASHPGRDQSLFLDDRRRIEERIAWRRDPSAWGQNPPSVCVRTVGSVEAWVDGSTIVASSAVSIEERRGGRVQHVAAHQVHQLVDDATTCRTKILLVPALAGGLRNPSFVL
jgi:3-phenylpropionate/cinnamic acid dioxygenase small subunit